MKATTRSPSPRNGYVVIPAAGHRMRGLFNRAAAFSARPKGARERAADVR